MTLTNHITEMNEWKEKLPFIKSEIKCRSITMKEKTNIALGRLTFHFIRASTFFSRDGSDLVTMPFNQNRADRWQIH